MTTPVFLVALLGIPALIGIGPAALELRTGFTSFLATPAALPAIGIGVLYEGLFVFTTLIFLDRREYSFCVPVHVCSSLLAGVAASLGLRALFGVAPPSGAQVVAAVIVVVAALVLSYPSMVALHREGWWLSRRAMLFVCGGNTLRSPMAAAIRPAGAGDGVPTRSLAGVVRRRVGVESRISTSFVSRRCLGRLGDPSTAALVPSGDGVDVRRQRGRLLPHLCPSRRGDRPGALDGRPGRLSRSRWRRAGNAGQRLADPGVGAAAGGEWLDRHPVAVSAARGA